MKLLMIIEKYEKFMNKLYKFFKYDNFKKNVIDILFYFLLNWKVFFYFLRSEKGIY